MDIMLQRVLDLIGERHGSAQELTRAINCPKNAITAWKSGRTTSYRRYAPQIAEYYGVSLDWLSGLSDDKNKKASSEDEADERIIQLKKRLDTMSEDQLDKLIAMMDLMGL